MHNACNHSEFPRVEMTVISVKGKCNQWHKVGDKFVVEKGASPKGLCLAALNSIMPVYFGLQYGAEFPWENDKKIARVACPDYINAVVWELRRLDS